MKIERKFSILLGGLWAFIVIPIHIWILDSFDFIILNLNSAYFIIIFLDFTSVSTIIEAVKLTTNDNEAFESEVVSSVDEIVLLFVVDEQLTTTVKSDVVAVLEVYIWLLVSCVDKK